MNEQEQTFRLHLRSLLRQNRVLLLILLIAAFVWIFTFSLASSFFLSNGTRPLRSVWNGFGQYNFFGLTINFHFEGWADYDFYYLSWADQFLSGIMPYTDNFNTFYLEGVDFNTPFFLPPLFLYLCSFGALMGPVGPGALISIFGYASALPVYGIAKHLSDNRRVGEIAAATYLLNPLVLYHTAYEWLNPAPFVFFTILSFYLLMKNKRIEGTLAIATAILFKQIAIFFVLPLIAYLIRKPSSREPYTGDEPCLDEKGKLVSDSVDLKEFMKMGILLVVYVVAWSFPYILDPGNYFYYMAQKPGGTMYNSVTTLPASNLPVTFTVIPILFGAPEWLSEIVNQGIYYTFFLTPGVLGALGLSLFEEKDDRNPRGYWRRILFFTLILVLWVHIFSPRGIYKYYCVALMPFFSILPVSNMISKTNGMVKTSFPMLFTPMIISLVILIPNRNVYLLLLILVMIAYLFHKKFSIVYEMIDTRVHRLRTALEQRLF